MAFKNLCKRHTKSVLIGVMSALAMYTLLSVIPVVWVDEGLANAQAELAKLSGLADLANSLYSTDRVQLKQTPSTQKPLGTLKSKQAKSITGDLLAQIKAIRFKTNFEKYPFQENPYYKESTCPRRVASITMYSKWFKERFKPNIKIFLDKDDMNHFDLFTKYQIPFGFEPRKHALLQRILSHSSFSNHSVHLNGTRKECLRCAVVGCGGILKGSGAGAEIDSHDYVFRLNHAHINKFVKDVGRRTSFYIFFPESMLNSVTENMDKDVHFIYTMYKEYDMNYALNLLNKQDTPPFLVHGIEKIHLVPPNIEPSRLRIVHPDFFRYVFAEYLDAVSYRPTTGAIATFLALHLCDEVSLYGFGYDHRFSLYYYDTKFVTHTNKRTDAHDVKNERKLWSKLHEEGVIRLFKRDILYPVSNSDVIST